MKQLAPVAKNGRSSKGALTALSLTTVMPALATSSANVALPALAKAYTTSFQLTQWVVLSYLLAITAVVVVAGRLGDTLGRRRILLAGIAVFSIASLLCGLAPTIETLIALRVLQGVGAAVMMALTTAFISEVMPRDRVGSAMGLLGTMSAVGTMAGPAVGGLLIAYAGASAIFMVNAPVAALGLVIGYRYLPDDSIHSRVEAPGFDKAGLVFLIIALTAYALSVTSGSNEIGSANVICVAVAILAAVTFFLIERRTLNPLIRLSFFQDQQLSVGLATSALISAVMMATLIVGPFFLGTTLGLEPITAGLVLSAGPMVAALVGIPAGKLVDRFGAQRIAALGLSTTFTGACSLTLPVETAGVLGYLAAISAMTAGYGLFQAANNTAVVSSAMAGERGVVSGLLGLSRNLGLVTGASVMGFVFASAVGRADVANARAQDIAMGMHTTLAAATFLVFVALVLTIGLLASQRREHGRSVTPETLAS